MTTSGSYQEYTEQAIENFVNQDLKSRYLLVSAVKDKKVENILEVGCGAGQELLPFVEKTKAFRVGIDIAEEPRCLSRWDGKGKPQYAFVHGNLALANSCGGKYCGVDEEMQILQETGCYADMTLPSAPVESQVQMINQIYECGLPLDQKVPHRKGKQVAVFGNKPQLPLIFTGPLIFNWTRCINGLPVPRLDDGALAANQPMDLARLNRWLSANIIVNGCPDWIFAKPYCHGFFDHDEENSIGAGAERFFNEVIENGEKTDQYKVYFASAREAFNMVSAAIDGKTGSPGKFRDYRLKAIMDEGKNIQKLKIASK